MLRHPALRTARALTPASTSVARSRCAAALPQLRPLQLRFSTAAADEKPADPKASRLPKFLLKEAIIAPEGYNRYRSALPALATNICGGSVYAWSIFNGPLTRELGVVASSSVDWSLAQVVPVFSVNAACLGACTFATGKWLELVGPRAAGAVAATCFSSGLVIGGLGVCKELPGNLRLLVICYWSLFLRGCLRCLMSHHHRPAPAPIGVLRLWFPGWLRCGTLIRLTGQQYVQMVPR